MKSQRARVTSAEWTDGTQPWIVGMRCMILTLSYFSRTEQRGRERRSGTECWGGQSMVIERKGALCKTGRSQTFIVRFASCCFA